MVVVVVGQIINGMEAVWTTLLRRTAASSPNVLVAISNGMRAVILCTNRILQFLTGGAS